MNMQPDLLNWTPPDKWHQDRDGETFDRVRDRQRLDTLQDKVVAFMADQQWHTLKELHEACGGTEASCSARLRDMRKRGEHIIRSYAGEGLWKYRWAGKAET